MMRILYVIENIFFGGGELAFAQIINGLDKEKYEIYVACLPGGLFEEKIRTSAKLLSLDLRNRFNLVRIFQLAKIMKEKNIQIVHSQGGRTDFFARIAARIAKVPAVISTVAMPVERYDVALLKKAIYVMLDRLNEKFVDRFIVVSEALRERLIEKHKIPSEKIVKIYNGIEVEEYHSKSESVPKLRDEFNIKPDVRLVGTIGRLVWPKGLPYFIQAIKQIVDGKWQMAGEIKFLIVGEGMERKKLESMVNSLNLDEKVIFTGFRTDIKEILYSLDVLVLSSIREGQPIILLEAMAMDKPIVATNIEGVNETVVDGVTGILVPPRNPYALAEAIVSLLKDKKKAQEMGQAARLVVAKKFNLKDKVTQHEHLYEMQKALIFQYWLPWECKNFINVKSKYRRIRYELARFSPIFHNRYKVYKRIIELNLTNACNLRCINCASSCIQAPSNEHISLEQIEKFIKESLELKWDWHKIKLYGGEPTLHPQLFDIIRLLKKYKDSNPGCDIWILSNGTGKEVQEKLSKLPNWIIIEDSTKEGTAHKLKSFESYNVAPIDLKKYKMADFSKGCWRIERCGICLSRNGYYVCAPGAHVGRVFGFDIGLKSLMEVKEYSMEDQLKILCKYCGLYKEPKDFIFEERISATWKEAYEKYKEKKPELSIY